jgi:high affinity sulfate transporter 1
VPAIAPITSVILATLFVYLFRADKHGVQIVSTQVSIIKAQ